MPVVLLSATEYSKVLFKGLVSLFAGSVCLRVIGCADVLTDIQDAVVLPRLGSEPARRAEAGRFATQLTGPILGKVVVPMTVDLT